MPTEVEGAELGEEAHGMVGQVGNVSDLLFCSKCLSQIQID